jgi:hypothetical protein
VIPSQYEVLYNEAILEVELSFLVTDCGRNWDPTFVENNKERKKKNLRRIVR